MIASPYDVLMGFLILLSPLPLIGAGLLFFFGRRTEKRRKKMWLYVWSGVLLCWPVYVVAAIVYERITNDVREQRTLAGYERMKETLGAARVVQGALLPAGTEVVWTSDAHQDVDMVDLPGPSPLFGGVFTGRLDRSDSYWSGTLVSSATLAGWPCAAGQVRLWGNGELVNCVLSRDFSWFGRVVPQGTSLNLDWPSGNYRRLEMPNGRGMDLSRELPHAGLTVPAGGTLMVHGDGSLLALLGKDFQVRGVAFAGGVRLSYPPDEVGSQRDDEEGRTYPASTGVHGALKSGLVCEGRSIAPDQDLTVHVPWVGEEITTERHGVVTQVLCDLPRSEQSEQTEQIKHLRGWSMRSGLRR